MQSEEQSHRTRPEDTNQSYRLSRLSSTLHTTQKTILHRSTPWQDSPDFSVSSPSSVSPTPSPPIAKPSAGAPSPGVSASSSSSPSPSSNPPSDSVCSRPPATASTSSSRTPSLAQRWSSARSAATIAP